VIFHTRLHTTPQLGGPLRNIAIPFGMVEKLEWSSYLMVKKTLMIIFSRFVRIPACDRRTDRQTRRAVKSVQLEIMITTVNWRKKQPPEFTMS